jgi:hypothetical protein
MFGFIITRCVKVRSHGLFWVLSYENIRKFYPETPIIIIDDDSNPAFIRDIPLYKCTVIQSEFPTCGELLAYYYFQKTRPFERAVIIHDSVFINESINFDDIKDVKFLWDFTHDWNNPEIEACIIKLMDPSEKLFELYNNTNLWVGCFGAMTVITLDFIDKIFKKETMEFLIKCIRSRKERMAFERILACLCILEKPSLIQEPSIFGNIHVWMGFYQIKASCPIFKWELGR